MHYKDIIMALKSTFIVAVKLNYELYYLTKDRKKILQHKRMHCTNTTIFKWYLLKKSGGMCINNRKAAKRYALVSGGRERGRAKN